MSSILTAAIAGLIFGLGLLISGMSNPAKVLGFLDLAGAWDPSLALVMAGAIGVGSIGFGLAKRRTRSWLDEPMQLPAAQTIDHRIVLGSLAFGAGWGLAGFCPGPALVAAAQGYGSALLFTGAMLVGMAIFAVIERR